MNQVRQEVISKLCHKRAAYILSNHSLRKSVTIRVSVSQCMALRNSSVYVLT